MVVEHHGFQSICPNGQLLIRPAGVPCPGHFMAGRHGECLRCNAGQGWLASRKLWLLTFVRRFLCRRVSINITPTVWLGNLLQLPRVIAIPHGLEFIAAPPMHPAPSAHLPVIAFQGRLVTTKGVGVLFEAARLLFAQNRLFELLVIGDGPERSLLERLSNKALSLGMFFSRDACRQHNSTPRSRKHLSLLCRPSAEKFSAWSSPKICCGVYQ